jgi:hypothetical protein
LAVSSILNNPYNTNDIISVNKNSAVKTLFNSADLSQDIKSTISFSDNN